MRTRVSLRRAFPPLALHVGFFCLFTLLLYQLQFLPPVGADAYYLSQLIETNPFPLYYRSLLTVLLDKLVYVLARPLGLDGWNAIALSSALAGAFALFALWSLRRHPLFLLLNICSGSFLVFVGHVENYAWVNAFLLLSYAAFQQWFERDGRLGPAMTFYMLACLAHMLALFYAPAIGYALWKHRRYHPLEALLPLLGFLAVLLSLSFAPTLLGTDVGLERLVPLFSVWAPNQFFTFFSWAHGEILFYFYRHAAFLGIPFELPLLFMLRKRIRTPFQRFLLIHTCCGLFWTTIWHPDWGRNDWDLFSQFAIPLHVLLGLLLCSSKNEHEPA